MAASTLRRAVLVGPWNGVDSPAANATAMAAASCGVKFTGGSDIRLSSTYPPVRPGSA